MDDNSGGVSRRQFAAFAALGAAGVGTAATAAAPQVMDMDVNIKTADGMCNAALAHPQGAGRWPAVIVWTDAFGLRPFFREFGKRIAAEGYVVLTPNPFYRSTHDRVFPNGIDFNNPDQRKQLADLRAPMTPEAITRDAGSFVAFLDAQPMVDKRKKMGVQGYCMGGPLMMQTAAAAPNRIGAGASFHGGGLVTDRPDSPHLLVPKLKGAYYFAVADNDDKQQPDAKTKLKAAFDTANIPAKVEVYAGCMHGWCAADTPPYNKEGAERAWGELMMLYKGALV